MWFDGFGRLTADRLTTNGLLMARIEIKIDDRAAMTALNALIKRGADLSPLLAMIGEKISESTKQRFATSTAPDGSRWAPNAQSTFLQRLGKNKGAFSKRDGRLTSKGAGAVMGKKPLIGETKALSTTIRYQLFGRDAVVIGSGMIYAATHQFGAEQGEFGRSKRGGPIPWGNIKARPFLGISSADERTINNVLNDYLAAAWP